MNGMAAVIGMRGKAPLVHDPRFPCIPLFAFVVAQIGLKAVEVNWPQEHAGVAIMRGVCGHECGLKSSRRLGRSGSALGSVLLLRPGPDCFQSAGIPGSKEMKFTASRIWVRGKEPVAPQCP